MRRRHERRLEIVLQKILNEYPNESLERIAAWAARGTLAHDWRSCLNAAAVGHGIDGPQAVRDEIGVPVFLADGLAQVWDRLGDMDAGQRRTHQLVAEILASRRRCSGTISGFAGGAPIPDVAERVPGESSVRV
jgi:hypothetical protein